jgi:hypothetical protein
MDINIESRRVAYGEIFGGVGFHRTNERIPADEYTNSSSGSVVYFYWKQGSGKDITIGIDPSIDFKPLLKISGVRLRKTTGYPDGLRTGTAMRLFPKTFGGVVPKDKNSKVGRFFGIDLRSIDGHRNDQYLIAFLEHLSGQVIGDRALPDTIELNTPSLSNATDTLTTLPNRPAMSLEDFLRQQERKSETGEAGELVALKEEIQRITKCGCSNPEAFVRRISTDDVGRGYDIESTWPNEERFIEVKSSTQGSAGFYISRNERVVLAELGARGWIYLVELGPTGQGHVAWRLPDPMKTLPQSAFQPVSWRVQLPDGHGTI